MILEDGLEFTDAKAKAFCKWYLRTTVADVEDEFQTEDERKSFLEQRERRLAVQLDDLLDLNFNSPITCSIENKPYVKSSTRFILSPSQARGRFEPALGSTTKIFLSWRPAQYILGKTKFAVTLRNSIWRFKNKVMQNLSGLTIPPKT